MVSVIISCILVAIGSSFKARMDIISFRSKSLGWKNKWKLSPEGKLQFYRRKDWYYFGVYPEYEEKFIYSSTLFVCFTDDWHRHQFIFLRCLYMSAAIQISGVAMSFLWGFLIFPVLYGIGFNLIFERLRKK